MKIAHLSHTDLDGYACQFISNFYLKGVKFYNSNYGKEIDEKFNQILEFIGDDEAVVLITDLNLTLSQCKIYDDLIKDKQIKLILLDHHQSGSECAAKFSWYFLDSSRCATKIVYDFFSSIYGEDKKISSFADIVNAVDIWLKDDANFELGKVCMNTISAAKEINKVMFENEHIKYLFYLMSKFSEYAGANNAHIALDNAIHDIKKSFFKFDKDDTLSNLISAYLVSLLSAQKDEFTIFYGDFKGILTHNIGSTSVIGNDFLLANPEFDFFIDVTSKKTLSFRANGKIDVSQMAKNLVGGGGHINASGGFFTSFKDGFNYTAIKAQIVELIDKKTKEKNE